MRMMIPTLIAPNHHMQPLTDQRWPVAILKIFQKSKWSEFCLLGSNQLLLFSCFQLAELKGTFDRFAVDGLLTIGEACQALTESGVVVPRRDIFKHLRGRGIKGLQRNVNFFEFLYGYSSLRYNYAVVNEIHLTPRLVRGLYTYQIHSKSMRNNYESKVVSSRFRSTS